MKEQWKEIKWSNGDYMVSSLGRVKQLYKKVNEGGYEIIKGQVLPFTINDKGYASCKLKQEGLPFKLCQVHRLVAEEFVHQNSGKPQVNHIDGDRSNNRASNLEWVTQTENMVHAFVNGTCELRNAINLSIPDDESRDLTDEDITQIIKLKENLDIKKRVLGDRVYVSYEWISMQLELDLRKKM